MEINTGYNESARELRDACVAKGIRIISISSNSNKNIVYFEDKKLLLLFKNCTYIQISKFIDFLNTRESSKRENS